MMGRSDGFRERSEDIDISIIIVSWNVKRYLESCLSALYALPDRVRTEIIVVDNASKDGSADLVAVQFPQVRLIRNPENEGFAHANNRALPFCRGRYVMLLNPDTEARPGALDTLCGFMDSHPDAGAAAPQLVNPDLSIQPSCRTFPGLLAHLWNCTFLDVLFSKSRIFGRYRMTYWNHADTREVDQPMGAALLVRAKTIDDVGAMDPAFFLLFDEVDWCRRMKNRGWKIFFVSDARVIHHGGRSIGQLPSMANGALYTRSRNTYFRKHTGAWSVPVLTALDILKIALIASPAVPLIGGGVWLTSRLR